MQNQAKYTDTIYHEVQRQRQVWLWVIVLGITGLMWYTAIMQLIFHTPVGSKPASDPQAFVFWLIFGLGFPILFFYVKLETEVRYDGIQIRFFPYLLRTKKVAFTELSSCQAIAYRPLLEYRGWGIRLGAKGWAYSTSGHEGVELQFQDGKTLLIGSQRSEELYQAIQAEIDRAERQSSTSHGAS